MKTFKELAQQIYHLSMDDFKIEDWKREENVKNAYEDELIIYKNIKLKSKHGTLYMISEKYRSYVGLELAYEDPYSVDINKRQGIRIMGYLDDVEKSKHLEDMFIILYENDLHNMTKGFIEDVKIL